MIRDVYLLDFQFDQELATRLCEKVVLSWKYVCVHMCAAVGILSLYTL